MIVSAGKGRPPTPSQRRRHERRQWAFEGAAHPNPVTVLPPDRGRGRTYTRYSFADTWTAEVDDRNTRTRSSRQTHRYDTFDGQLIAARFDSTCSVCSTSIPSGEACWYNPVAHWVTCTGCRHLR